MLEKVLDFKKIDVSNRYIGRHRCILPIYRIEKNIDVFFEVDTPCSNQPRVKTTVQEDDRITALDFRKWCLFTIDII